MFKNIIYFWSFWPLSYFPFDFNKENQYEIAQNYIIVGAAPRPPRLVTLAMHVCLKQRLQADLNDTYTFRGALGEVMEQFWIFPGSTLGVPGEPGDPWGRVQKLSKRKSKRTKKGPKRYQKGVQKGPVETSPRTPKNDLFRDLDFGPWSPSGRPLGDHFFILLGAEYVIITDVS